MLLARDPVLSTRSCPLRIEGHLIVAETNTDRFFKGILIHQNDTLLFRNLDSIHRHMAGDASTT
jgi:hypothetical protein